MRFDRSRVLRILTRVLGLGLVAYVLVTQVRWTDSLTRKDGTVLRGVVSPTSTGWRVEGSGPTGAAVAVPADAVRVDRYGGRDIPAIAYGLPSLARRISIGPVALVLGAIFVLVVVTAWRWRWLVEALGLVLSARDAVRFTLYGMFFNLVVPGATGGDVVKAWYAAKRTGVATKAVVSVFVDRIVGLFALVLFSAAVLFLGPQREGYGPPRLLVGIVLLGSVLGGVLVLSQRVRGALGLSALLRRLPFQHVLSEIDAAMRLYRRHPGSLGLGLLVSFANHAGNCLCVYVLARAMGLDEVRLGDAFALVPVVSLLSAIPLLPGGWGVGELAFAYFFGQVGVAPSEAVGLSVVYRLANLVSGLPGGFLWIFGKEHARRADMASEVASAEREVEREVSGAAVP